MTRYSLRPARTTDAGKLGAMLSAATRAAAWMPRLHTEAEDIAFAGALIDQHDVTVITAEDDWPLGFLALEDETVISLYVAPVAQGLGLGQMLLRDAKTRRERLELWTFQANTSARRFYERAGFEEVERTDGAENDEGLPDLRYEWLQAPPEPPLPLHPDRYDADWEDAPDDIAPAADDGLAGDGHTQGEAREDNPDGTPDDTSDTVSPAGSGETSSDTPLPDDTENDTEEGHRP